MARFVYRIDPDRTTLKLDPSMWERVLISKHRTQEDTWADVEEIIHGLGFVEDGDGVVGSLDPVSGLSPENVSKLKSLGPVFVPGTRLVMDVDFGGETAMVSGDSWVEYVVSSDGWLDS